MFGHTLRCPLAMGYVENEGEPVTTDWVNAGRYELEVAAERVPAVASLQPFYDPQSLRVRA
jgi:4-methylaminobutanoate oxidase (formaldehyde-forming)